MWRIWFFFGILKISFSAPVETSHEDIVPSPELAVLKCLLSSPANSCDDSKHSVDRIPKKIQKLFEKLKRPLLNTTGNDIVDSASLEALPASLLYLIPKVRLSSMTGFTASNIVRRFPLDDALTMKLLSLFTDKTNIKNFLNGLAEREEMVFVSDDEIIEEESITGIAPISSTVEKEIAHALSRWFPRGAQWEYWLYKASMITGTPVLASLPNYFLNSLSLESTEKFLFHLRNWRWDHTKFYNPLWSKHSMSVKRIWGSIVVNKAEPPQRWTPRILKQFGFFLVGATPDELSHLSNDLRISQDFKLLLDLSWNMLQARAVFDVGFSGITELSENDLNNMKTLISYLLPRQIQQFSRNNSNFNYFRLSSEIPLATEKQLFQSHLAYLMAKNKTKNITPTFWRNHINVSGKFYHLLPADSFENFENENLDLETLMECDSSSLSFIQARYLTNSGKIIDLSKPETVLKFKGFLKAVPSLKLIELPANMISQNVKEHLLMFASEQSVSFIASILEKVRGDLTETSYLEKMLYNKDFQQYFNLLGNRIITEKYREITSDLINVASKNPAVEKTARSLPVSTLSALMSSHRQEVLRTHGGWNFENLIESPLNLFISGLTCNDIEVLETSDFMPVIGYYVRQKRALNENFPKNMQYCCQKALTKYFKFKALLRGYDNEPIGLLSLLELHEVRAIGGYILAGLPISIINTLGIKHQIIAEIGKLTIPELLTATPTENIKKFSEIYITFIDDINLQIMNGLGNLFWFLNEDKLSRVNVQDFKLYVESLEENQIKSLCLNEKERSAWKQLLIRTFGKTDSWSAGTLAALGDLMFVFDSYELERINKTSRIEAADVLSKSSSFFTKLEWPGKPKPIHLYEVCLEILKIPERISYRSSVKRLLQFYLESNQYLIETISSAQKLLKLSEEPNLVESVSFSESPVISTHIKSHIPVTENVQIKINPSHRENAEPFKSFSDFSSDIVNNEDEDDDDFEDVEEVGDIDGEDDSVVNTDIDVKNTNDNGNIDLVDGHSNDYDEQMVADGIITFSRGPDDSEESSELKRFKNEKSHDKSIPMGGYEYSKIFQSQDGKSYEARKEELQRNASRALIVEVPLNRTDFKNFDNNRENRIKISCDAMKMLGKASGIILETQNFEKMDYTELEDCAEYLGTINLDFNVKKYIWSRLKKWRQSGNLLEVGSLVSAIEENDLIHIPMKLNESWALENLHVLSSYITDQEMMLFIADQFLMKNMDISSLNFETVVSLNRLICSLTSSHQRKYLLARPDVFINAVKYLGRSLDCSTVMYESCLRQLAGIAKAPEAFGETHNWSALDVSDLGVIVAGLKKSDWQHADGKGLKAEAFAGLSPSAVSCIPPDVFKVLTNEQLLKIPTLSAAAVSSEQSSSLSPSQYEIIDRVRRQIPPEDLTKSFTSNAPRVHQSYSVTINLCVTFYLFRTFFYA